MKKSVALLYLVFLTISGCTEQEREISKPNIIYIMADDLGYGDLGCYGSIKIKTPNIDKLAENGIRLTDAHSPSAVCTPTRYGVLTGRYSWRGRLKKEVLWSGYERSLIEKDRKTIGNMMQEKGYETAQIGKWHLGWEDKEPVDYSKGTLGRGPNELGFDYSFVTASAHNLFPVVFVENHKIQSQLKPMDYFIYNPELPTPERIFKWHKSHDKGPLEIAIDWKPDQVDKIYTDKAASFINNHINNRTKDPFYLHLTPEAPHLPNNVPNFMKGKSEAGTRGDHIQMLDWMVGEIINTVDRLGVADHTLIILTSDNGPKQVGIDGRKDGYYFGKFVTDFGHKSAGDLRGFKASIWEGGHRVPFIAKWPNKIAASQVSDHLICLTDMMASFAAIIGYDMSEDMGEDSFNVLPVILGDDQEIRESIIHQDYGGNLSIRQGDFKLIDDRLYSFSKGINEEVDVAGVYPEKVLELKNLLEKQVENHRTRPHAEQVD